jgi:hypothetical protein
VSKRTVVARGKRIIDRSDMTSTSKISPSEVLTYCQDLLPTDVRAKQVLSMAGDVTGVRLAASAAMHAVGLVLAVAEGTNTQHCIEKVDQLHSSPMFKVDHSTLAPHLATSHGRGTQLIRKMHQKKPVA